MIQSRSTNQETTEPQCIQDTRTLLTKYSKTIAVGTLAALTGMLLCVLLKPQPKLVQRYNVTPSEVATWSSSHETLALDLASDSCPGGGHAQQIFYDHNNFSINCEAPRLSRRAYVTLGITITSLALMMAGSPPDLCMLGATLVLILWPWPDTPGKGIITESEAWQGFSNKGVLTVGALFVVLRWVRVHFKLFFL